MKKGIDVSVFQRKIDWEEAKEYIDFAIVRCGYGNNYLNQDDEYYKYNADECTRLKIPFGTYLYSYALDLNMAQSEVDHTLRLIKNYKLEYPIFLDVEDRDQLRLPKETLTEIVDFYCKKIEEAGYYVGIYASLNTFLTYLDSEKLDKYDKWVAEWSEDFTYRGVSGMWQRTDNDKIPGIVTRVDGDVAFYDYPSIIREKGLNHLGEISRKYKVGDTVKLSGNLYGDEDGKTVIRRYRNKKAKVVEVSNKDSKAPYKLDIGGQAVEEDLSKVGTCILNLIWNWIKNKFS